MAGRTLLQQAQASTFGLRAAGWFVGLEEACAGLREVAAERLAVQMGGPVGTRAPQIGARVAAELGLVDPTLSWAAIRVRPAELASALGVLAGVFAKIAADVVLFSQTEVGELREGGRPGRGGSWQAEWGTLGDLLALVGSAAAWSADLLVNLEVDVDRMRENAAGLEGDLDAVDALIDRALAVRAG